MTATRQHSTLEVLLQLNTPPVAITFAAAPPEGVEHIARGEPAGCGYWRRAGDGEIFYTTAADHVSCPVGAHTHGVSLSDEDKQNLMGLIDTMVGLEYLKKEDIPHIPTRKGPFGVVVYAPLARATQPVDVVLVRGNVRQLMLLAEAAEAAGVAGQHPTSGRPTCAVLPLALDDGRTAASFGCIGNRVYTGLTDGEGYYAVPGDKLEAVEERLGVLVHANRELEAFHRARLPVV
jgi:uncharacterized protein (DUF169 family)